MPINKQDQQQTQQQRVMRKSKEQQSPVGAHPDVIIQRAIANPKSLSTGEVLQLQRTIGNQKTIQLLRGNYIQRETGGGGGGGMMVTPHNDEGEQEANSIAAQVMQNINRKTDMEAYEGGGDGLHVQRSVEGVQRSTQGIIQRDGPSVGLDGGETSSETAQLISSFKGTGTPIPDDIQRMSTEAGAPSMKGGELVSGPQVDKALNSVGGIAATVNNTIMLHRNAPSLDTKEGVELLNHENVHRYHQGAKN